MLPRVGSAGHQTANVLPTESGRYEIYVAAFPSARNKWQVSTQGGRAGTWIDAGRRIIYSTPDDKLLGVRMSVVDGQPTFESPTAQFGGMRLKGPGWPTPDGLRFIEAIPVGQESPSLTMVNNWRALVERGPE